MSGYAMYIHGTVGNRRRFILNFALVPRHTVQGVLVVIDSLPFNCTVTLYYMYVSMWPIPSVHVVLVPNNIMQLNCNWDSLN